MEEEKMSLALPICDFCKHLKDGSAEIDVCDAFPEGIPCDKMRLKDDGKECAKGIYYAPIDTSERNGGFKPKPGGLLEKFGKNRI